MDVMKRTDSFLYFQKTIGSFHYASNGSNGVLWLKSGKIQFFGSQVFADTDFCRTEKYSCILKCRKFQMAGGAEPRGKFLQNLREQLREISGQLTVQDDTFRREKVPEVVDSAGKIGGKFIRHSQSSGFFLVIGPDQIVYGDRGAAG